MALSTTYFTSNDSDGVQKKFGATTETVSGNQVLVPTRLSTLLASESGGASVFRSIDLDETEEEVKATAGQVYGYYFANLSGALRYLKFYNATAANVTVGTTAPVLTLPLPYSASNAACGHVSFPVPVAFGTAITVAVTTGLADNDTGAPGSGDVVLNVFYK